MIRSTSLDRPSSEAAFLGIARKPSVSRKGWLASPSEQYDKLLIWNVSLIGQGPRLITEFIWVRVPGVPPEAISGCLNWLQLKRSFEVSHLFQQTAYKAKAIGLSKELKIAHQYGRVANRQLRRTVNPFLGRE